MADTEGDEDEFRHLGLTIEEAEPDRHFPASGLPAVFNASRELKSGAYQVVRKI